MVKENDSKYFLIAKGGGGGGLLHGIRRIRDTCRCYYYTIGWNYRNSPAVKFVTVTLRLQGYCRIFPIGNMVTISRKSYF